MQVVDSIPDLREVVNAWRCEGVRIAFVPTMGHLHQGHLSLIERARECSDRVVASVYVNPMQFDRIDDLSAYPRTLAEDIERLQEAYVDLVFTPDDNTMYPGGHSNKTRIEVPGITDVLCGAHRPGHFVGVATIVCKLFNMVQPDVAIFGEKDFQQLMVVRQMASDLDLPVEIVGAPTWREGNGLAMSSRNSYLSAEEFDRAAVLYQLLCDCADDVIEGNDNFAAIEARACDILRNAQFDPDFVAIRRSVDLGLPEPGDQAADLVVLVAAYLGSARLIDNVPIADYIRDGRMAVNPETSQSAYRSSH
ncbi:MAG: pantoate--beta-alanine ligase [Pseudomonadota bacterium]